MSDQFPVQVLVQHKSCCLVSDCTDEGCELDTSGWSEPQLFVIGGTPFQRVHHFNDPLCDFTLFGLDSRRFVCAVEMKGGRNLDAKHAVQQIQGGLTIAAEIFSGEEVDVWHPILLCHRGPDRFADKRFLLSGDNFVEFHGRRKLVELHRCGCSLSDVLHGVGRL